MDFPVAIAVDFVDEKSMVYLVKCFCKVKYDYVGLFRVVEISRFQGLLILLIRIILLKGTDTSRNPSSLIEGRVVFIILFSNKKVSGPNSFYKRIFVVTLSPIDPSSI